MAAGTSAQHAAMADDLGYAAAYYPVQRGTKRGRIGVTPYYQKSYAPRAPRVQRGPYQETKYFDVGINAVVAWSGLTWADSEVPAANYVNSSGTAASYTDSALLPTAIGSGYGEVNGNRYQLKKIRVRGVVHRVSLADEADISEPIACRLLMVMDTQPNGAQAQGEDILQDIGAREENVYSFKRVSDSSQRFRILKDKFFLLQVSAAGTDGTNTNSVGFYGRNFSFQYKPRNPITVNIKSGNSTPTVAGLVTHNIFLLLAGTNTGGGSASLQIDAASRVYYCD